MKKLFLFLSLTLGAVAMAADTTVMRYRFATINDNEWIDPKREADVAKEIDHMVGDGFNGLSMGTYDFMPMYFVDYSQTKYPEAQEFDAKKVAQNVATLRKNIQLAKTKGIRFFVSRSYSHYAPYNFWKAHKEELNPNGIFTVLLEKAHQNEKYLNSLVGKDRIVPQQQWTNPVFRDFFLDSTARMLDAIPELDGFLNAYAEAAWTYDLKKLPENKGTNWKEAVDYAATDDNFVDYSNRLYRMLKEKRGARLFFGMRDWYVKPEVLQRLQVPRDQFVIAVKYAGYDAPLINYPPWGKTLQDAGYAVLLDIHEYDAEHPHPLYWYDPDIIYPTFRNIYAGGFAGIQYQDYTLRGGDTSDNPIRVLTEKTVGLAMQNKPWTAEDAEKFLRHYYGDGARDLLASLKAVSVSQTAMIKLCPAWFWQGDGLTPGGLQTLKFWMLMDNPDAPPGMAFVRQDVVGVKEFVAAKLKGDAVLASAQAAWKAAGKQTPEDVVALMLAAGENGIEAAKRFRAKAPADAPYLKDIFASAVIHEALVRRDAAFVRAAIAFYESGGVYDDKYNTDKTMVATGMDRRDECLKQLRAIIEEDEVLRKLCYDYAPRRRTTRSKNDYAFEKKVASILGQKLEEPPVDQQELDALVATIGFPRIP